MENFIGKDDKGWIKADNYLSKGSFGLIELWRNEKTNETIVIKKCAKKKEELSVRQRERWADEVKIMEFLNHENIIKTNKKISQIIFDEIPVLCMEYCKKGNLRELLKKEENYNGVNEKLSLKIMSDILSAVEYLHENKITHFDIKPENIVIQELDNDKLIFKLIDLGYAKVINEKTSIDSINYIAPEIYLNIKYNFTPDYWSMGILFYEILTGVRPFLPNISLNQKWIDSIKLKDDDDIAAREIDKEIIFSKTIEDPTNISECLRDSIVPWFRLVLQWDPKKREKINVFKMLREIMEKKIIQVFYVTRYKNDSFEVDNDVNILRLKEIIFEREKINVDEQMVTTWTGEILEHEKGSIVELLGDLNIIVFENDKLMIEEITKKKLPKSVCTILTKPKILLDYFTFKKFYYDCFFFMSDQIGLYRSYTLSLRIKINLCEARFASLQLKIQEMLEKVKNLDDQIKLIYKNQNDELFGETGNPDYRKKLEKIQTLIIGSSNLKKKIDHLGNSMNELKNKFLKTATIDELSSVHKNAMDLIKKSQTLNSTEEYQAIPMVKLIFNFFQTRDKTLGNQRLNNLCRKILEFENMLIKLEKSLTSFNELLPLYQDEVNFLFDIIQKNFTCATLKKIPIINIVETNDSVIYDNIMLGHMIDSLMDGINKMKKEAESMDTDI